MQHKEYHRIERIGWLRAAVLGANDGIISTASLLIGVAAAHTPYSGIFVAGIAGLIAGAMSMAAGEYILGAVAAKVGGARILLGALRVVVWGAIAMFVSAGIGSILGISV